MAIWEATALRSYCGTRRLRIAGGMDSVPEDNSYFSRVSDVEKGIPVAVGKELMSRDGFVVDGLSDRRMSFKPVWPLLTAFGGLPERCLDI